MVTSSSMLPDAIAVQIQDADALPARPRVSASRSMSVVDRLAAAFHQAVGVHDQPVSGLDGERARCVRHAADADRRRELDRRLDGRRDRVRQVRNQVAGGRGLHLPRVRDRPARR